MYYYNTKAFDASCIRYYYYFVDLTSLNIYLIIILLVLILRILLKKLN